MNEGKINIPVPYAYRNVVMFWQWLTASISSTQYECNTTTTTQINFDKQQPQVIRFNPYISHKHFVYIYYLESAPNSMRPFSK